MPKERKKEDTEKKWQNYSLKQIIRNFPDMPKERKKEDTEKKWQNYSLKQIIRNFQIARKIKHNFLIK
jgi:hypothetical protein